MVEAMELLQKIEAGDPSAAHALLPLVYEELRRLASVRIQSEKPGQTLTPTGLVHEAYLRLVSGEAPQSFNGRAHFFGAAAQAMRRILVERARQKKTLRRGGDHLQQELHEDKVSQNEIAPEVVQIHEALEELARHQPELARLVELKYFAGLSIEEVANILGISVRTTHRQWSYAKAYLKEAIDG